MFKHAIVRKPGEECAQGLTTSNLGAPVYPRMLAQHEAYVTALRSSGLKVIELEALIGHPDAYFVEDTALVTPDVAVITHPGAPSRQGEDQAIADVLQRFRKIERILPPGNVEGGDVLVVENHYFIGISERTNEAGAKQLGNILEKYHSSWSPVPVGAGLHLKSSVNYVGGNTLLLAEDFVGREEFKDYNQIVLDRGEEYASNTLLINNHLIMPAGYPRTKAKLGELGLNIIELDMSEVRKMDGGLTCMSLRF